MNSTKARALAAENYRKTNGKYDLLVELLTTPYPVDAEELRIRTGLERIGNRLCEIEDETGITISRTKAYTGNSGNGRPVTFYKAA